MQNRPSRASSAHRPHCLKTSPHAGLFRNGETQTRTGDTTIFRDPGKASLVSKVPANWQVGDRAARCRSLRIPAVPRGFRTSQGGRGPKPSGVQGQRPGTYGWVVASESEGDRDAPRRRALAQRRFGRKRAGADDRARVGRLVFRAQRFPNRKVGWYPGFVSSYSCVSGTRFHPWPSISASASGVQRKT